MAQNAGSDSQSYFGYVGIAEESAFGGNPSPTQFADVVSDGFSGDNAVNYLSTIRGRDTYQGEAGEFNDEGSLDLPVSPEGAIGLLLKGAFGSVTTSVDSPEVGANTHTFTTDDKLPTFGVEVGVGNVDAIRHAGVAVDTLELSQSPGDRVTASTDLPAQKPKAQGSQSSPTYDNLRTFQYHDATVNLLGTDRSVDAQDVTVEIANSVDMPVRTSRFPDKAFLGQREVTAEVTLDFENMNVWEAFWGGAGSTTPQKELADVAFNIKWVSPESIDSTSTAYSLEVDMPRCKINTHEATLNEQDMVAEDVELRAVVDTGGVGYDVQANLIMGVSSY
jgi:hypothetical protein